MDFFIFYFEKSRVIDYEDAERIADAFKGPYIEISSKEYVQSA